MIYFIIIIVIATGLQFLLEFLLAGILGWSIIWVNILVDLALSVFFALVNFRGREKLRNPQFHRYIATTFAIFSLISILFYIL